jgi:putative ABC transport system permease protein
MIKMGITNRAFRNVWRKKTRTLLVALALGFLITMIIAVNTGVDASKSKTQDMIDDYKQHILEMENITETQLTQITVMNKSSEGFKGGFGPRPPISQENIDTISSIDFVDAVVPMIMQSYGEIDRSAFQPGSGGREKIMEMYDYIVYGVPLDSFLDDEYNILPLNIVEGRKIVENDSSMVLIKEELKGFFDAEVGDTVTIENMSFEVAGIYSSEIGGKDIYMSLSDARELIGLEEGEANQLSVYAENDSAVDGIVYDISELFPGFRVFSYGDFAGASAENILFAGTEQINQLQGDMERIETTGNQIIIISVITAGMIVLFMMLYTVKERTKEIGILKALGFTGNSILSQFVIEGTVIGLFGGIFGVIIGWVAAPSLSGLLLPSSEVYATSTPSIVLIALALCLTLVLGAFGSLYPAYQASKKSPMEAMRNE